MAENDQGLAAKYLALAREAEKQALACPERSVKDKWFKIALGYREMALQYGAVPLAEEIPEQVPPQADSQVLTQK